MRDFCNRWTVVAFYQDVNFRDALGFVACPTSLVCGRCGLQRETEKNAILPYRVSQDYCLAKRVFHVVGRFKYFHLHKEE